jgi:TetR/AcrR family transcriptional regulator
MSEQDKKTEELIFDAAREVFTEKGFDGARMEEISQKAGINKALLHYYYRTKEKLFNAIFDMVMGNFFSGVTDMMNSDAPLFTKIEFFVDSYITMIIKNPMIPNFIMNELNRNPQRLVSIFESTQIVKNNAFGKFSEMVREEVKKGNIEPIEPEQLIVNLIGLCIFPFVARPIIQGVVFKNDKKKYNSFLESRKKEVAAFIINSIKKK